jgi:hypothetical protein
MNNGNNENNRVGPTGLIQQTNSHDFHPYRQSCHQFHTGGQLDSAVCAALTRSTSLG